MPFLVGMGPEVFPEAVEVGYQAGAPLLLFTGPAA